ncbi:MAG: ABC transporter ATP-binding protein [Acidobacteria bacterium]|nr:ABC transporter ATP-binding protein [Acidobacteriota bacterium]MBI3656848.1 ABC transporter ATP-binding protein [Acidobacteriota bacterium]
MQDELESQGPLIECLEVTKLYRMGNETIHALDRVSFAVNQGEFIAILGTSGSGKSTLLNLLGGLDRPTGGEVRFRQASLAPLRSKALAHHRRKNVGMIFQSFHLIPTMTALDNVALPMAFDGLPLDARRARAEALLARLGLGGRLHHRPPELSGGEQQRVAMARALANNPAVLLADEPTGNLDSARSHEILQIFKEMNEQSGQTLLLVTHDLEYARRYARRFIHLVDGKIAV